MLTWGNRLRAGALIQGTAATRNPQLGEQPTLKHVSAFLLAQLRCCSAALCRRRSAQLT